MTQPQVQGATFSHINLLLGPAGSGKTHHCLEAIRSKLKADPEGPPLLLITPRQATFQMEAGLLKDPELNGFTRLQILSFPRLADFILGTLRPRHQACISEEGRVMVMRSILNRCESQLKLFGSSTGQPGLAAEVSQAIRQCQHQGIQLSQLRQLAERPDITPTQAGKLHDLALIHEHYHQWLGEQGLLDADQLLDLATEALKEQLRRQPRDRTFMLEGLWLDGFASLSPQERSMLKQLVLLSQQTTLAFCADSFPEPKRQLFSIWLPVHETIRACLNEVCHQDGIKTEHIVLPRCPERGRFKASPMLSWLESSWTRPTAFPGAGPEATKDKQWNQLELGLPQGATSDTQASIELVDCASPEDEIAWAARRILDEVQHKGLRFNQIAVLLRSLDGYQEPLLNHFSRLGIPCFIDQRQPIHHHPLVAMTRSVLRLLAYGWQQEDWFTYLKSGLIPLPMERIDALESAAIEYGWRGADWWTPLRGQFGDESQMEEDRLALIEPFKLMPTLRCYTSGSLPQMMPCNGPQLVQAIRCLWDALDLQTRIESWDALGPEKGPQHPDFHQRVLESMETLLANLEMAFAESPLPISQWATILESGTSILSIGVVPPSIDQVMVGAIDRSRQSELSTVILLGVNESIFPARPGMEGIWDTADCQLFRSEGVEIGRDPRMELALERFLAYIACTRADKKLLISHARMNARGDILRPSVIIHHLQRMFPNLELQKLNPTITAEQAMHERELLGTDDFWRWRRANPDRYPPKKGSLLEATSDWVRNQTSHHADPEGKLDPWLASWLHGRSQAKPELKTSITSIEAFAQCPFRYFLQTGLKVREQVTFELDARRLGTFQHALLESFHLSLRQEKRLWHELSVQEAKQRLEQLATETMLEFHQGLIRDSASNQLIAASMSQTLGHLIGILIEWMQTYRFEPSRVELKFGGQDAPLPAWKLPLDGQASMVIRGVIDRLDLCDTQGDQTLAVVIDYKSSPKKPDLRLSWNGLQLQLPVYLNVMRQPEVAEALHQKSIRPVGAFFVSLKGGSEGCENRSQALDPQHTDEANKRAHQHHGCFDLEALKELDSREGQTKGDQFVYRLKKDGSPFKDCWHAMSGEQFKAYLERCKTLLKSFGNQILQGDIGVRPYRNGQEIPCTYCDYASICRIPLQTHPWRDLESPPELQDHSKETA